MATVIEPTTDAAVSKPFRVKPGESVAVVAYGLAGVEEAVIQISPDNGVSWQDIEDESGTMTATAQQTSITSGGLYRVSKTATAGDAGVSVG